MSRAQGLRVLVAGSLVWFRESAANGGLGPRVFNTDKIKSIGACREIIRNTFSLCHAREHLPGFCLELDVECSPEVRR